MKMQTRSGRPVTNDSQSYRSSKQLRLESRQTTDFSKSVGSQPTEPLPSNNKDDDREYIADSEDVAPKQELHDIIEIYDDVMENSKSEYTMEPKESSQQDLHNQVVCI